MRVQRDTYKTQGVSRMLTINLVRIIVSTTFCLTLFFFFFLFFLLLFPFYSAKFSLLLSQLGILNSRLTYP